MTQVAADGHPEPAAIACDRGQEPRTVRQHRSGLGGRGTGWCEAALQPVCYLRSTETR